MFDYLIVGAGFAGSVLAERLATQAGKRVLILDKRPHIGGNAYDHYNDDGLLIHKYGPHIFHTNCDDRYFTDTYQVMPLHGYTRLFERMLSHPNIKVLLNCDYQEVRHLIPYREMIFTGPIDQYFDYCFGKLPYRSLEFRHETLDEEQALPVAVVNYPNEHAYTRVTEFKHLTGQQHAKTGVVYEFPRSEGDPYYPI